MSNIQIDLKSLQICILGPEEVNSRFSEIEQMSRNEIPIFEPVEILWVFGDPNGIFQRLAENPWQPPKRRRKSSTRRKRF